jgi:hypothetical protein
MNRSRASLALISAAALLIVLLAACKDTSLSPVFYTLENERQLVDDRGMDDNINVFRVVSTGTRYFAAAGTVYWRDPGAGQWHRVAPPVAGALCNHIEYFATNIVAWFYAASNGSAVGLYTLDPANIAGGWTDVTTTDVSPTGLSLLKAVHGLLFIAHEHSGGYRLYAAAALPCTNSDIVQFPGPADDVPVMIHDVAYDTALYWVATLPDAANADKYLFTGAAAPGLLSDPGSTPPATTSARPAGALYFATDNRLYLSTENGKVFFREAGTWSTWPGDPVKVSDAIVRFTEFVEADTGYLFVGSQANGYYRFAAGTVAQPTDLTRQPSYNISALYNGAVRSFLAVDDPVGGLYDPDILFACTYGNGLWRADYDPAGSEPWPWVQE